MVRDWVTQELSQYLREFRALVYILVPVAKVFVEGDKPHLPGTPRRCSNVIKLSAKVEGDDSIVFCVENQQRAGDVLHIFIVGKYNATLSDRIKEEPVKSGEIPVDQ